MYSIIQLRNSIFFNHTILIHNFCEMKKYTKQLYNFHTFCPSKWYCEHSKTKWILYIYNIEGQFIHNLRCLKICKQGDLILLVNYAQMSATFQVLCGVQVMKMLIWCFEFSCLNFKLDIFVNCSYCSILFFSFLY